MFTPRKVSGARTEDPQRSAPSSSIRSSAPAASTSPPTSARSCRPRSSACSSASPTRRASRYATTSTRSARDESERPHDVFDGAIFAEYIDWRIEHPSDDVMTQLLHAEFEDETGTTPPPHPRGAPRVRQHRRRGRQRHHPPPDQLDRQGARRAPRPAADARRGPRLVPERDRGGAALRAAAAPELPVRRRAMSSGTGRRCPRAACVSLLVPSANRDERQHRRSRPLRHPPEARHDLHLRLRDPLLHRSGAGAAPGSHRARRGADAVPRVGSRLGQRQVRVRRRSPRVGFASRFTS